jgi:hypothetical protein
MKLFQKLYKLDRWETDGINRQLAAHPELWDQNPFRRTAEGSAHSEMRDIWVRYNDVQKYIAKGDFAGFNDEHVPVWYEAWDKVPALKEVIFNLMAAVDGEMIGGVLITRIPSGCGIGKHVDKSWHVDYYDKFYISLEAAPGAKFWSEDEVIEPEVGDVYRFDNRHEHWVTNDSGQDRVTLIVCIRTDKFK